jgi:hypothetical protein
MTTTKEAPTMPDTITLMLTAHEVNSLFAWLNVTEPDTCGGEANDGRHDATGHAAPDDDECQGYCPGDIADLWSIADKMLAAGRAAGW